MSNNLTLVNKVNITSTIDSEVVAPLFITDTTYLVAYNPGDTVIYNNVRYKCTTATISGTFDPSCWEKEDLQGALETSRNILLGELDKKINKTDIINNLGTPKATQVLAANMGKYINENVMYKTDIIDNLTTARTDQALSANMGKKIWSYVPKYTGAAFTTTWAGGISLIHNGCIKFTVAEHPYQVYQYIFKIKTANAITANTDFQISDSWLFDDTTSSVTQAVPWVSTTSSVTGTAYHSNTKVVLVSPVTLPAETEIVLCGLFTI